MLDFRRLGGALASRRGLFGLGAVAGMALARGIVLMANAISVRVNHRFDFTGLSQFTLTNQTKEVLAELEEPVEVVSFFNPADPRLLGMRDFGHNLLAEYQTNTDLLTLRSENPELRPDLARRPPASAPWCSWAAPASGRCSAYRSPSRPSTPSPARSWR